MRGYSTGKIYSRTKVSPYVDIWEQPLWRRLVALAYHHWWERHTWRIMKRFEKVHEALVGNDHDFFIPLSNRQDIRCDDLVQKGRKTLARVHITKEQYDMITRKRSI